MERYEDFTSRLLWPKFSRLTELSLYCWNVFKMLKTYYTQTETSV